MSQYDFLFTLFSYSSYFLGQLSNCKMSTLYLSVSQVDPGFAYAYTLLGHEFVLTEELDRALACFRNAIRVNNRHYNAWYGNHGNYDNVLRLIQCVILNEKCYLTCLRINLGVCVWCEGMASG